MARAAYFWCVVFLFFAASNGLAHTGPVNKAASPSSAERMKEYALVLVEADSKEELAEARDFISSQGGRVAFVLPPHAILGWISPDVESKIAGQRKIRSVHRRQLRASASGFTDRETRAAIKLFNDFVSGRSSQSQREEGTEPKSSKFPMVMDGLPRPPINKDDFIRNLRSMGAEASLNKLDSIIRPTFFNNSDVMDGTVAVAVFFVESIGGADPDVYTWSAADRDHAFSQVIEGLNWWVNQSTAFGLARPLQFTVVPFFPDNPVCRQPFEPVLHSGSSADLWIDRIMANVGSVSGDIFARVAAFDARIRDENRANWAFTIFLSYNPSPARPAFADGRASWAYIGGPHANVLFRSYGWELSRVISHETGHIFYACDEYFQPGFQTCSCTCAPEVRRQATNGNCEDANCNRDSIPCMMRLNELGLCQYTVAQIGWTDIVLPPPPSAPSGLIATGTSPSQVELIWQDTSKDTPGAAQGFKIERRGGSSAQFSQVGTVNSTFNTFTDTTVLPDTAYSYRIHAFNRSGESSYSNEASVVTPKTQPALAVNTGSLPDATVGVPYSRTLTASGGRPDYTWIIQSGSLPEGLSLSQTGTISGTPVTAGTSNFVARVSDADNLSVTKGLSLVVKPIAPLTITTKTMPKASVGTIYSQNLGASGGQTPYNWAMVSGNLPDGLSLNQTTGVILGTPERAGSSSFTISLSDATGVTVTEILSIAVNPATFELTLKTESLPDGVVGEDYSHALKAEGGNSPYRWEIKQGRLPDGLQLSVEGVISGRPTTPGELEFEIQVTDLSGQSVFKSLSIDIEPPPELTITNQARLPLAAIGLPYRVVLNATAGITPYKWVKKNKPKFGTLPDGITLFKDGMLSGTPTVQGTFDFTIRVVDASGKKASKPFTIEVGPPPPPLEIRTAALPNAAKELPYNFAIEAVGGLPPYSWSIENGIFPDGLTMSEAGVVSGNPTTIGSTTVTVRVQDSIGTSSLKSFSIIVGTPPPPLVLQTTQLPDTAAERPYLQTLQATGGVPPYTWAIQSGSLGQGLNLSAGGVISGTPLSPGTNVFVVRVTDSAQQTVSRTLAIKVTPADKTAPFGNVETPDVRSTLTIFATVTGWALDNVGVAKVQVLLDGAVVGDGIYGLPRADIAAVWGGFPNAMNPGFNFTFDTRNFTNGLHTLSVRILDAAGNAALIGEREVKIQNQTLAITTTDLPKGKKGETYNSPLVATNGAPPYSWSINSGSLPQGLSLSASGIISGTPSVFGNFSFSVRVRDSADAMAVASFTLVIVPDVEPLRILTQGDLVTGTKGTPYSVQLLATGGRGPYLWSMGTGSLPPGLSLDSFAGRITGTPTQIGTSSFTVRITDSTQTVATSETLRIKIELAPLTITSSGDLTAGTVGVAYTHQLGFSGGQGPYAWSLDSGALPAGLALEAATGKITGTPTQGGEFTFTVKLTDSTQNSVTSDPLMIDVTIAPLAITSSGDLTAGTVGAAYIHQLQFSGGQGPFTWSIESGELPAGLALEAATGKITGAPTAAGEFTFTVKLTDSQPANVTSDSLKIIVSAPPPG